MSKWYKIKALLLIIILVQVLNISIAFSDSDILTSDEREFLNELGEIQMIVDDNYSPISYYDIKNNEFGGIAVEVMKELSKLLDFKYTIIRDDSLTWADKLEMIKNNKADVLGGASIKNDRAEYGYFTNETYFQMNYAIIGSIDKHIIIRQISDLAKYRIGLIKATALNDFILDNISADTTVQYFDIIDDALLALKNHEIDITAENEAVFTEEYFKDQRFDFEIVYSVYDKIKSYAFFTPKTDAGLILSQILDKGMKRINIDAIVADRYQNKGIFAYYKEYSEKLREANEKRNDMFVVLICLIIVFSIVVLLIKIKNNELEKLAKTDFLTKLRNRDALFYDYNEREKLEGKRVYFIDLDDFKIVNDKYGHDAGDEVLICISKRLSEFAPKANIYRLGGDEFLLVSEINEENYGEKLLDVIKQEIPYKQIKCRVGASIGYIETDNFKDLMLHEIINLADYAMLEAKANGKNTIFRVSVGLIERFKDLLGKKL